MQWFGNAWPSAEKRAPICENDAERVPAPLGEPCLWCAEPIVEGDRGEIMEYVSLNDGKPSVAQVPVHAECSFRQVMGGPAHINGTCTCCGGTDDPDLGMTPRDAAKYVWKKWAGYTL